MIRIGHRGAMGYAPENTIASFQKAIDLGCDEVETDVWLAADGRLVISHDRPEKTAALTLDEVLDFCRGRVSVNVELKSEANGAAASDAGAYVARHLAQRGDPAVYLSSLWISALEGARAANTGIRLAYVFAAPVDRASLLGVATDLGLYAVNPSRRVVDEDLVNEAHASLLSVQVWTVNDPEEIARLERWDVDGIISDFPDRVPPLPALARLA